MAQVKKLSVGKVFGKIDLEQLLAAEGKQQHVMRAGGRAIGVKEGMSDYGDWKALVGDFVAFSGKDGSEHRAPYLFLPDVALNPLLVALSSAKRPDGSQGSVDFLMDIHVKYSPDSQTRYEYTWTPVVAHVTEDPIAALLTQAAPLTIAGKAVGGSLPALPAPDADAERVQAAEAKAAGARAKGNKAKAHA